MALTHIMHRAPSLQGVVRRVRRVSKNPTTPTFKYVYLQYIYEKFYKYSERLCFSKPTLLTLLTTPPLRSTCRADFADYALF